MNNINPRTDGTVVFGGARSFNFRVDTALVNENGKTIATNNITLTTDNIRFNANDTIVNPPIKQTAMLRFPNVRADDLTPTLTIVIRSVNGISSRELNASGYMKISPGDIEERVVFPNISLKPHCIVFMVMLLSTIAIN